MGQPYPGRWSFKHYPWLKEMHDSDAMHNVGQKSAQMGYTETVLNITFFQIDICGNNCLYVLPALTPDAHDFSSSRFDPALEASAYLRNLFSDVKNVGHKRAGKANMFIRGSRSRAGLKSVPTGFIVLDEVDEMEQDNIELAYERASGQTRKQIWEISTPTAPGYGINKKFRVSTQEHFQFKCPSCDRFVEFMFPDSIVIKGESEEDPIVLDSYYQCTLCKNELPHNQKVEYLNTGHWVKTQNSPIRGFYINQMYSSTVTPGEFAQAYFRSLTKKSAEQEFWNSKNGLEKIVGDAALNLDLIDACRKNYTKLSSYSGNKIITLGYDVGTWLHVVICGWDFKPNVNPNDINTYAKPSVLTVLKLKNFEELDNLMRIFSVRFAVGDANPERRKANEFSNRHYGRARICFYASGQTQRIVTQTKEEDLGVNVDRTSWLDLTLNRFRIGTIDLPMDIDLEFRQHCCNLVRVYSEDKHENQITEYKKIGDDHYAHALNYAEVALQFACGVGIHQDVKIKF